MAQNQSTNSSSNSGFTLPAPTEAPAAAPTTTTATVILPPGQKFEGTYTVASDTSSRDLLIGGGVLLALFIAFFFARGAYANSLVGRRVPPAKANAAGWWLFIFMGSLATGLVLSVVNASRFLTPVIMGSVASVALLALILMLVTGRK
ncbi:MULTISPECIES: hypothetical protein [unclassified Variovorax]|uniref:hypothetical protein n=1 Tax=unclassified Variovorax TaxID=663243 RepID=UPI0008C5D3E2|nr:MULTISPECIES: hypothetical protein [unclassified Variovorax]SEK17361.1 hypothetical protein SAMN05518853_1465 [Variovorax sp. OK202]SFE81267.1 hypothetical protein SAMN05444746_1445 [Variovorax sp. OK212]